MRLISVADIDSRRRTPGPGHRLGLPRGGLPASVARAGKVLDVLTPWSSDVRQRLPCVRRTSLDGVGPQFALLGWRQAFRKDVLWPTDWWFRIRYGVDGPAAWLWYRTAGHPLRLALAVRGWARKTCPPPPVSVGGIRSLMADRRTFLKLLAAAAAATAAGPPPPRLRRQAAGQPGVTDPEGHAHQHAAQGSALRGALRDGARGGIRRDRDADDCPRRGGGGDPRGREGRPACGSTRS